MFYQGKGTLFKCIYQIIYSFFCFTRKIKQIFQLLIEKRGEYSKTTILKSFSHTYKCFFSKKVSKSHYSMKNEGYISNTQNLLSNETSLKIAKEVSWKYHNFLEMHHKNTNKKQKNAINKRK